MKTNISMEEFPILEERGHSLKVGKRELIKLSTDGVSDTIERIIDIIHNYFIAQSMKYGVNE